MSLVGFHRLLIAGAILFCYGFAGWQLYRMSSGSGGSVTVAGVFIILGSALAYYLYRLRAFLKLPE